MSRGRWIVYALAVLAGFALVGALFRMTARESLPPGAPPQPASIAEIQRRAESFVYERGVVGGEMRLALGGPLQTFNIALAKDATTSGVLDWLYEGLLARNRVTNELEPRLAAAMPRPVDEEGRVWDVELRRDVRWFDGKPLTADDVVFTLRRIVYNDDIQTSWRYSWLLDDTDPETGRRVVRRVQCEKIDDYTVRFTLPYAWAYFFDSLTVQILPRHVMEKAVDDGSFNELWSPDINPRQVIGCGAFKLASYTDGERVVLERNPDYFRFNEFGDRMPYLDRLSFQIVTDASVMRDMFLSGEIDFVGISGRDMKEMYARQAVDGFTLYRRGPSTGTRFLVFNLNSRSKASGEPYLAPHKVAWFRDLRFRQAVAHAVDRNAIRMTIFQGFAFDQHGPVSPANTRFFAGNRPDRLADRRTVEYPFDPDRANRLLDEMGFTRRNDAGYRLDREGNEVEFTLMTYAQSPEYAAIGAILKSDLKRAGIRMTFQAMTFDALVSKLMNEWDWEAIIIGLTGGYDDPMNGGRNVWPTRGNLHMWSPKLTEQDEAHIFDWERELDEIFERALKTPDEAARVELAARFQHIVSREAPMIYTCLEEVITGVRDRFSNFAPSVYSLYDPYLIFDRSLKPASGEAD